MYIVYGIPNCDTTKKALSWLKSHKIAYTFHDYKKEGISEEKLASWCNQLGWESLLNKRGTTWRGLDAATQSTITNKKAAIHLLAEQTSMIKRPVIEKAGKIVALGFDETSYQQIFKK